MCKICHQTVTWFNKHEGLSQIIVTKWFHFKLYVRWNTPDKAKGLYYKTYCVALFIFSTALTPYWQSSISVLKYWNKSLSYFCRKQVRVHWISWENSIMTSLFPAGTTWTEFIIIPEAKCLRSVCIGQHKQDIPILHILKYLKYFSFPQWERQQKSRRCYQAGKVSTLQILFQCGM